MASNTTRAFSVAATVAVFAVAAFLYLRAAPSPALFGYSNADSATEVSWEQKFRALPQPANVEANMKELSAYPHNVGTERQHQDALWILKQFQADGLDAHIEQFQTLYPTPLERKVELLGPNHSVAYEAVLKEPAFPEDPTSGQAGQLPTMVMYSADGDVTAPLVYANYGVPADYDQLDRMGISVKGKIVITRYGQSWRGIKPKLAYMHGAVGCLIYSDPRDDGYFQGDVMPKGAYRPDQGVQRGSVMEMELYPGDPETPGWGSVPGAKRLPLNQVTNLQKIPVLPISYGDALPLLKAMDGPVAPENFRGALPITYHLGSTAATVHLVAKFNWGLANLYDVIATIPGSTYPNQWIIRGNHFDAWVNGADDPISGQSSLIEEARSYGVLLKQGWRPKRTIVYAAWDGEEPSLIGSTEWAETHAAELQQKAVAYFNSDTNSKGYLNLGGSQTLQHFLNTVAQDITDPETGKSVWAKDEDRRMAAARTPQQKAQVLDNGDLRISALGSGSDYSPFLQHLGIASADLGYGGEGGGGVYHSIYDDFYWYTHFSDTTFVYGRALAQTMGTAIMRLASADVLPLQFTGFADNLSQYQDEIEAEYHAQAGAPSFDFKPLEQSISALKAAAADYDQAMAQAGMNGNIYQQGAATLDSLNNLLYQSERKLLASQGLPRRPWYQHQVYAPGFYTGYGVKTLPGLREAIEQKDYAEAAREESVIDQSLDAFTAQIKAARAKL
ncbi:MAG TPA: transferrin receptor-like dimerization domain-containing protein [Terriglobales bacterium]|nr:transferrin receptor-like dimerization domain-containing protein [Terriglobales bacterium]